MAIKAKLVDLLQRARDEIGALVAGLSDEDRAAVGTLEHWSVKDLVAHLAEWQARTVQTLAAAGCGETPPQYDDIDQANAEIWARYHDRSWADVLGVLAHAQAEMVEHVQAMTEDDLADTQRFSWLQGRALWRLIVGNEYLHPVAHLTQWYTEHGQAGQAARLQEETVSSLAALDEAPDWQGLIRYNLACYYALSGRKEQAIATLTEALRSNPGLAGWSKQDPDLTSIREEPAYRALVDAIDTAQERPNLLDRSRLLDTLTTVLDRLAAAGVPVEYRLVGTGAALLHGVSLPAADVDLLVKRREDVDRLGSALASFPCLTPPAYRPEARHYYAAYEVNGIEVGISTVEWETDSDGIECLGTGPWEHFALLPCGAHSVPTVALELRLVSELARSRPDRVAPLIQHLQAHGCDVELVRRGMAARQLPPALQKDVLAQLTGAA